MTGYAEYVKDYMIAFGSISSMEAFRDLGITRLAAVIHNMRKHGYEITAETEATVNRYGKTVYFTRYRLKGNNSNA